jgi:hypothetical protein
MNSRLLLALFLVISFASSVTRAETYYISVQPILPPEQIVSNYQPLADYLSKKTGHQFEIKAYRDFLVYWIKMKKAKDMDFVLDAAHFTDFRVQRKNYRPLVKIPDTVSLTVISGEEEFIFDMDELISKKIATMPSPSMGAVRLNQMFPNPVRLPFYVKAKDSEDAVNRVLDGSATAAIIPSPLVSNYENLNTVVTTEPVPHMALSASPDVPEDISKLVTEALVNASQTQEGKAMLEALRLEGFEKTDKQTYEGYANLLDGMFGY